MQKSKLINLLFVLLNFSLITCNGESFDVDAHLLEYKKKLNEQPDNCFFAEQVGAAYGRKKEFNLAIEHYKKALQNCPDEMLTIFDLGVLYYLNGEQEEGVEYMNQAIELARLRDKQEHIDTFIKERDFWLLSNEAKKKHLRGQSENLPFD